MRYKRGYRREDGMIFYTYNKDREVWYNQEQFDFVQDRNKRYVRECIAEYNKKPHPPLGTYDIHRKMYFLGRVGTKERWVNEEKYLKIKQKNRYSVKEYVKRCAEGKKIDYKIGDPHPSDSNLFFVRYVRNRPFFRDKAGLDSYVNSQKRNMNQCARKRRIRRSNAIKSIKNRIIKGTERDGNIFWDYDSYGREIWLDPKEYQRRYEKNRDTQRRYRERRNDIKNSKM